MTAPNAETEPAQLPNGDSGWTFGLALQAATADGKFNLGKLTNPATPRAGGAEGGAVDGWFKFVTPAVGGHSFDYRFGKEYFFSVDYNEKALGDWATAIKTGDEIVMGVELGSYGAMDVRSLDELAALVNQLTIWLSYKEADFQHWARTLDSDDSGFKGSAGHLIQDRLRQNGEGLADLVRQISEGRGYYVATAVNDAATALRTFSRQMAETWRAARPSLENYPKLLLDFWRDDVHDFLLAYGLYKGTPNYVLDHKVVSYNPDGSPRKVFYAEEYARFVVSRYPWGDLRQATTWTGLSADITRRLDLEINTKLDKPAGDAIRGLRDAYLRSAVPLVALTDPTVSPTTLPPPDGPGADGPPLPDGLGADGLPPPGGLGVDGPPPPGGLGVDGPPPPGGLGVDGPPGGADRQLLRSVAGDLGPPPPGGLGVDGPPGGADGLLPPSGAGALGPPIGLPGALGPLPPGGFARNSAGQGAARGLGRLPRTGGSAAGFTPGKLPAGTSTGGAGSKVDLPPLGATSAAAGDLPASGLTGAGGSAGLGGGALGVGGGPSGAGGGSGVGAGLQPAQLSGGSPHAQGIAAAPGSQEGMGGIPFFPPMMGGMGGGAGEKPQERERHTWLAEDEAVWGTEVDAGTGVIGRPDDGDAAEDTLANSSRGEDRFHPAVPRRAQPDKHAKGRPATEGGQAQVSDQADASAAPSVTS